MSPIWMTKLLDKHALDILSQYKILKYKWHFHNYWEQILSCKAHWLTTESKQQIQLITQADVVENFCHLFIMNNHKFVLPLIDMNEWQ